jgi:predicted DCC family thiol-disulfide oxidoreductase YuxK
VPRDVARRAQLVLYDEGCGACTSIASLLARRGVRVAPIGSATGDLWLRDLDRERRYAAVHAVDGDGRRHTGGAAVAVVLSALPGCAVHAALARAWPPGAEVAYRVLARHRGAVARILGASRPASRARAG